MASSIIHESGMSDKSSLSSSSSSEFEELLSSPIEKNL
jgi:hypothetical protein